MEIPSRSDNTAPTAPRLSGRSSILDIWSANGPRATNGTPSGPGGRMASNSATDSPRSRRAANSRSDRVGGSSHWTSSTATRTGCSAASARSTPRNATPSTPGSSFSTPGSSRSSATANARRCGTGSDSVTAPRASPRRSRNDANENRVSASTGLHESTRYDCCRAISTAHRQSTVLPIPGSPSRTIAAGSRPLSRKNCSRSANSACRPINSRLGTRTMSVPLFTSNGSARRRLSETHQRARWSSMTPYPSLSSSPPGSVPAKVPNGCR